MNVRNELYETPGTEAKTGSTVSDDETSESETIEDMGT
jgi:hypothetical protein